MKKDTSENSIISRRDIGACISHDMVINRQKIQVHRYQVHVRVESFVFQYIEPNTTMYLTVQDDEVEITNKLMRGIAWSSKSAL